MEEFFDIPNFEGLYKISKSGIVKSVERIIPRIPKGPLFVREKFLKSHINHDGYPSLQLSKNGKSQLHRIHILLAKTFIPNPNNYKLVRHLNDNREDYSLSNLAWGTYRDNTNDAKKNGSFGNMPKGKKHYAFGKGMVIVPKMTFDVYSGIFYDSIAEAADAKSLNKRTLQSRLNGRLKNNTGLIYA